MNGLRLQPPEGLQGVDLDEGTTVYLGRAKDNTVVLDDKLVSSRHSIIEVGSEGPVIRDLGSKNGTWVNGQQIQEPRTLGPGDEIAIGRKVLKIATETAETKVEILDEEGDAHEIFASLDATDQALKEANRDLAVLHGMGELMLDVEDEDDLCARLIDLVFDVLPADRACVILADEEGALEVRKARARTEAQETMDVSRTILQRVVGEGISLITSDATVDERFQDGKSIILQGIRAAMCVPIRGRREVLGALYADTQLRTGVFTKDELELLSTVGTLGGLAVENLRLAQENIKAERLAAIGGVVAGLAHDIRNVLGALKSGAYLMEKYVTESDREDVREAWGIFRTGTDTITALVEDMVSYSKERDPDLEPVELNRLAEQVVARFGPRAEDESVTVMIDLAQDVGTMSLDARAIDRVLSNLLSNAMDALSGGDAGLVEVRTISDENEVKLEARDDGCGIPAENLERIFDLLFSTKGSKGTGFGLAVTKKIATEHGGRVEVESEPGQGTCFRVVLPRG